MRFGRALIEGSPRILVRLDDGLRDLGSLPGREAVSDGLEVVSTPVSAAELFALRSAAVVPEPVAWLPPIGHPPKNILCVGKNYAAHVREIAASGLGVAPSAGAAPSPAAPTEVPPLPVIFTKAHTALSGHRATVSVDPSWSTNIDYEGELAVVIGRGGRDIATDAALDHVFGYSILNDMTARDRQKSHNQWFLGKSHDGFAPMGPFVVSADEIPDPQRLRIQTRVNDEVRQDGSTEDMIFPVAAIIATLSQVLTLEPGDIIATGTPEGVGQGFDPPRFLANGDKVSVTIDGIGTLETRISLTP